MKSVGYHAVMSLVSLVEIQPLSCKYKINCLLMFILHDMQNLNAVPWQTTEKTDILWSRSLYFVQSHVGPLFRKWTCLHFIQYLIIRCDDLRSTVDCQYGDHYCGFSWQSKTERDGNYNASNDKAVSRTGTMLFFNACSVCPVNILMAIYISVHCKIFE